MISDKITAAPGPDKGQKKPPEGGLSPTSMTADVHARISNQIDVPYATGKFSFPDNVRRVIEAKPVVLSGVMLAMMSCFSRV